jgi:hypothetical protein
MAKASGDFTQQLRAMCSASPAKCQAALKASKGDVDKALRALIVAGDVTADDLDPELTAKEHYALFPLRTRLTYAEFGAAMVAGGDHPAAARKAAELQSVRDQLAGKKKPDKDALWEGANKRRQALEARRPKGRGSTERDARADADPVAQLGRMSSIPAARCRAALRTGKGDLHAALRSMIASGEVLRGDLDPDLCTEEHYALVAVKRLLDHQQGLDPAVRRIGGITAAVLRGYRDQLSGKKPVEKHFLRLGRDARDEVLGPRAPKRPKKTPSVLKVQPFPPLKDNGDWEGTDVLTSWAGFQSRGGAYTSRNSSRPSKGKVEVRAMGLPRGDDADDDDGTPPPSAEQVAAYRHLKETGKASGTRSSPRCSRSIRRSARTTTSATTTRRTTTTCR